MADTYTAEAIDSIVSQLRSKSDIKVTKVEDTGRAVVVYATVAGPTGWVNGPIAYLRKAEQGKGKN